MSASNPAGQRFGRFELQPAQRQLLIDGEPAAIGSRAFDLLSVLIDNRHRVVPKSELLDLVWPGLVVEENNLQVQISALRKLLGPNAISTIPGRGYQFSVALDAQPPGATQPTATPHDIPNNLPLPHTRFIGRETALADCARLLRDVRLLTMTGIGGCGKTRLALQLAHQQSAFPDGVWFVDLTPLQDAQQVTPAVAAALGVREQPGTPLLARVTAHLAARCTLIVLDNCEHVIEAVAEFVAGALAACAQIKVVATSREALGVAGEQVYPVGSMSLPATSHVDAIANCDAARFFVDCARLTMPDFAVDPSNAAAIAEICRRLDGIALAIELAAARVKMLSVDGIRTRLDDRFRLLTGGRRALPRQQTLLATMHWSHALLSPPEQQLLRQLSVFAGSWTLAAAAHVAGEAADEYAVLERLTHLHDKSLLVVDRDSGAQPRYRMLETVRQYAHDRLEESGEGQAARARHLTYYKALAQQASPHLRGPQQGQWMALLRLEQENLLAAHEWWKVAPESADVELRLAQWLLRYWLDSAQIERGYRLARDVLEICGAAAAPRTRFEQTRIVGIYANYLARYDEQIRCAQDCVLLARDLTDTGATISALTLLANGLGITGHIDIARSHLEEVCRLARAIDDQSRLAEALNGLGELHREAGDLVAAETCYEEAISIARARSDPHETLVPLINTARVAISTDRLEPARAMLLEGLEIVESAGLKGEGRFLLDVGAALACALGDHASGAHLHGAALARMSEAGGRREPVDEAFMAPLLERSRSALGMQRFEAAENAALSLDYEASMAELKRWLRSSQGSE